MGGRPAAGAEHECVAEFAGVGAGGGCDGVKRFNLGFGHMFLFFHFSFCGLAGLQHNSSPVRYRTTSSSDTLPFAEDVEVVP